MSLESIDPIAPMILPLPPVMGDILASRATPTAGPNTAMTGTSAFGQLVSDGLQRTDTQLLGIQADMQQLASGNVDQLHHLMIRIEESRISLQLLLQVRNRLLESYQELTRMQV